MSNGNRPDYGSYIVLNGKRHELARHKTDFTVQSGAARLRMTTDNLIFEPLEPDLPAPEAPDSLITELSPRVTRLMSSSHQKRDSVMNELRRQGKIAHHIYELKSTPAEESTRAIPAAARSELPAGAATLRPNEIVIDKRIFVHLYRRDPVTVEALCRRYDLRDVGTMGDTAVLEVTDRTGMNPLKAANLIADVEDEVRSSNPQVLIPRIRFQNSPADSLELFRDQWYLSSVQSGSGEVDVLAGAHVPEAWQITRGDPAIVVAVMDDGFDLGHPCFQGTALHPEPRNFVGGGGDVEPGADDYHGTPVASIAIAAAQDSAMTGVAPGCTLLPIRIGFGLFDQFQSLLEFRYASDRADVLNCSFGFPPLEEIDPFDQGFRQELSEMTRSGGRRGRGLVIVFAAGNDDAPTRLRAADNVNGVRFARQGFLRTIAPGTDIFSVYPGIDGVVVVAAATSLRRKSGYSNWGEHITLTAPSNNFHALASLPDFQANYRGLGQIAASNRPGHGQPFIPLPDDPGTIGVEEQNYTFDFGGTSGAAPVVSGVAGLMLSANPDLDAQDVKRILMATADRNLDPTTDLAVDPNHQGFTGEFVNGRSLFFGAGRINAYRAVRMARALAGPAPAPPPPPTPAPALASGARTVAMAGRAAPAEPCPPPRIGIGALRTLLVRVLIASVWRREITWPEFADEILDVKLGPEVLGATGVGMNGFDAYQLALRAALRESCIPLPDGFTQSFRGRDKTWSDFLGIVSAWVGHFSDVIP